MREYIISESEEKVRLDLFLSKKEANLSRTQIQKLIKSGYIKVNDKPSRSSYILKFNDKIIIEKIPEPQKLQVLPENIPLDIVYEDSDLIVVNKKRGMVVHPAPGNYTGTLVNALLYHSKNLSSIGGPTRPGIVHRLDKDTSGLLVVAKNDLAYKSLSKQIRNRTITRNYIALVHGRLEGDEGWIEAKIGRHPVHRKKMAVVGELRVGREALTHYRVLERLDNFTIVKVEIKTGRTHQIRVHLSYIGHPVVGDPTYGPKKSPYRDLGQFLHAETLGFIHPRTGRYMEFKSKIPEDMEDVIKELKSIT